MNITLFTTEGSSPSPSPSPSSLLTYTADEDYSDYEALMCDRSPVRVFRRWCEPPLFWIITLVGGAGNLAVVWIYLNFRRRLKTMSDVYLLNLAIADLLFVVTLPLWAAEASHGWNFGLFLCKLTSALYKVNLFSGTLLLTCISADRYVAIVEVTKAQNSQLERLHRSRLVCAGVWLLALLLATPELLFSSTVDVDSQAYCRMVFPPHLGNATKILLLALQVSVGFLLPFVIMTFCYSVIVARLLRTRSFERHKAMRVVLVVVVVFVLSQLPYNGVLVVQAAQTSAPELTDCEDMNRLDMVGQVLKSLAFMHAGLNPFLYAFVGVRFRRDVLLLLRCRCCRCPTASIKSPQSSRATGDSDTSQALSL